MHDHAAALTNKMRLCSASTSTMRPPSFGTLAFQMRSLLARLGSCFVTKICDKKHVDQRPVHGVLAVSNHALRPGRTTAEDRSARCLFAGGSLIASSRSVCSCGIYDQHETLSQGPASGSFTCSRGIKLLTDGTAWAAHDDCRCSGVHLGPQLCPLRLAYSPQCLCS